MSRLITWNKDKYYNYSEILKSCKLTFKALKIKTDKFRISNHNSTQRTQNIH